MSQPQKESDITGLLWGVLLIGIPFGIAWYLLWYEVARQFFAQ